MPGSLPVSIAGFTSAQKVCSSGLICSRQCGNDGDYHDLDDDGEDVAAHGGNEGDNR